MVYDKDIVCAYYGKNWDRNRFHPQGMGDKRGHRMQYRKDRKGNDISLLGYGCMRFARKGASIDLDKAEKEVMTAINGGVNYLDTAYIYPGSEAAVGEILQRNQCRDKVYIATKLPHYLIKSVEGAEKTFQEELKRLKTDHVDYYLMHMLTDLATWEKLKSLGVDQWIESKLASGQIRNIGFSYHGNTNMFCQLVDAYDWDFCQIQYNRGGGTEICPQQRASCDYYGTPSGREACEPASRIREKIVCKGCGGTGACGIGFSMAL